MLFLKIVLAVVLVVIALLFLGYFWLRRKAFLGNDEYQAMVPYLPSYAARIRLEVVSPTEHWDEDLVTSCESSWPKIEKEGFERMGQFVGSDGCYIILGKHGTGIIVAVIGIEGASSSYQEFYGVNKQRAVHLLTQNPAAHAVQTKNLRVERLASVAAEDAIEQLVGDGLSNLTLGQFVKVYERVFAAQMDIALAQPPTLEFLQARAKRCDHAPAPEGVLAAALECSMDLYYGALDDALLDNARVKLKLDADTWDRLACDLVVIRKNTGLGDLADLVEDSMAERLLNQFEAQGMAPIQAFRALNRRIGPDRAFVSLTSLRHPVAAEVFARVAVLRALDLPIPEFKPGPGIKSFLYTSELENGQKSKSMVVAVTVKDARTQLQRMGHSNTEILGEYEAVPELDLEADFGAALAINSHTDSLLVSVVRIFLGNWLLWMPFTIWGFYSLYQGSPFSFSDYLAFTLALISLVSTIYIALPTVLYTRLLHARSWGNTAAARRNLKGLQLLRGATKLMPAGTIVSEEAKLLAAEGKMDEALDVLGVLEGEIDRPSYLAHLAAVYDSGKDPINTIATQAEFLALAPDNMEAKLDLALSILRHTDQHDRAGKLLKDIHPHDLSEVSAAVLLFCQGLLEATKGESSLSISKLGTALDRLSAYTIPLVDIFRAEINGYLAVFLKQAGRADLAESLWLQVEPMLSALSANHVIDRYSEEE